MLSFFNKSKSTLNRSIQPDEELNLTNQEIERLTEDLRIKSNNFPCVPSDLSIEQKGEYLLDAFLKDKPFDNYTFAYQPIKIAFLNAAFRTYDPEIITYALNLVKNTLNKQAFNKLLDTSPQFRGAFEYLSHPTNKSKVIMLDESKLIPKNTDKKDPENGDPEKRDPEKKDPENGDPEKRDPEKGDPEKRDPEKGDPEKGDPEKGDPEKRDPEKRDPFLDALIARKKVELEREKANSNELMRLVIDDQIQRLSGKPTTGKEDVDLKLDILQNSVKTPDTLIPSEISKGSYSLFNKWAKSVDAKQAALVARSLNYPREIVLQFAHMVKDPKEKAELDSYGIHV